MRIAFLIERFDPHRGGMETSAAEFLTELAALGPEIHVVTQSAPQGFSAAQIHALGDAGLGRSGRYRQFVHSAHSFLTANPHDVIHAVTPCLNCDLYQPRSGTVRESIDRTVAVRRSALGRMVRRLAAALNTKQRLLARLENHLLNRPRPPMVAALSSYMRRQIAQSYPAIAPDQLRTVFNGVRVHLPRPAERAATRARLRSELGLATTELIAIFAAHNFRRKGLARLVEAIAQERAAAWTLLVVGKDNPSREQHRAAALGISHRVRFLGSRSDVRDLYLAADACVLPTYYDPCSRTILEAMSLGLPCIATRFDGSADCITPGENGFVVESPECVDDIASALNALANSESRHRMAAAALALRPTLSMARHAREILALYEELVRQLS